MATFGPGKGSAVRDIELTPVGLRETEEESMNRNAWVALTGGLFLVAVIVSVVLAGEPPDPTDDSAAEVVEYYLDNDSEVMFSSALWTLAGALFVAFGVAISRMLREGLGADDALPTIATAGATIFAVGTAVSASLGFAAADLADEEAVSEETINTINAISWDFFFPFAVGLLLFFLATGIGIVRSGVLPKWLGWIAILFGVVALKPVGFGAAIVGAIWVLVVSVLIGLRARTA